MLRCIDVAIHIATNRVKARRRSIHRPPWQIPEARKPKRYFCVGLHRDGCIGIMNIALHEGGLSNGSQGCLWLLRGMTRSRWHVAKNAMRNRWPVRPIHPVLRVQKHRRIDHPASSSMSASSGWMAWRELTADPGLPKSVVFRETSNSGYAAEGYGASPHVNTCRATCPAPSSTRSKPRLARASRFRPGRTHRPAAALASRGVSRVGKTLAN